MITQRPAEICWEPLQVQKENTHVFNLSVYPSVCLSIYGISVLLLLLQCAAGLVCCYITSDTQNVLNRSVCTNTVEALRCLEELHTQQECLSEHSDYNPVKLLAD